MTPEIQFAKSGDVHVAYQVMSDGPVDLVWVPDWLWNLELQWEQPNVARFLERLASFSRLLLFGKRGSGLSDRTVDPDLFTLEVRHKLKGVPGEWHLFAAAPSWSIGEAPHHGAERVDGGPSSLRV